MENFCKKCGKTINDFDKTCSFCDSIISSQPENSDYEITEGLNEKFIDKKINIEFNLRTIVNELDYKKDFENDAIELVDEKYQYLQSDVTKKNYEKVKSNIKYYQDDLNNFRKNGKHKLEIAGTEDLQEIIAKFNSVVNMCNKYKKFIPDKTIVSELDHVIYDYNKEINYIKQYFVLPLYEADKILAASRLAKNLINVSCIFFIYFILARIPFMQEIHNGLHILFGNVGSGLTKTMFTADFKAFSSYIIGLGATEVLFAYYISFTIKNRNFKVDRHKDYEPIKYFVPVFFFVSLYAPILTYGYNIWFIAYLIKTCAVSFVQNRIAPHWLAVKAITIGLAALTIIDVLNTLF